MSSNPPSRRAYRASESEGYSGEIRDNPLGVDLHDIEDTSGDIHSLTPYDILSRCDLDTSKYRITHIESVIRHDLRVRFLHTQRQMLDKLRSGLAYSNNSALEATQPRIAFHGSSNKLIPFIIENGLSIPDRNNIPGTQRPKKGIYTSPSATHALGFSDSNRSAENELPGFKLVVCAVLLGRIFDATNERLLHSAIPEGYDSIRPTFSPEFVVEVPSQVLPLYVFHLDKGPAHARSLLEQPTSAQSRRDAHQRRPNPLIAEAKQKKSIPNYQAAPLQAH